MRSVTSIVIGAGHAGLAISHELAERSIDHAVLERGEVANSWKTERWDSLRLLTPNWQSQLPGHGYEGDDPDGFMAVPEVVGFIEGYAAATSAPVETHTRVTSVAASDGVYRVETDNGVWQAPTVVLASGGFNVAHVPALADGGGLARESIAGGHTDRVPRALNSLTRRRCAGSRSVGHRGPDRR